MRYEIEYKDKKYTQVGENAQEAIDKFAHRQVFGKNLIFDYKLLMYDADTRGEDWAKFMTRGDDEENIIMVSKEATNV
jgi:hypothetical protein